MHLFHALFDHFFSKECQNAVPFGRPGSNPSGKEGKQVLDRWQNPKFQIKIRLFVFSGQDSGDDYIQSGYTVTMIAIQIKVYHMKLSFIRFHLHHI